MSISYHWSDVLALARSARAATPPLGPREPARPGLGRADHAPDPIERILLAGDALAVATRALELDPALALREVDRALGELRVALASAAGPEIRLALAVLVEGRLRDLRRVLDAGEARLG